MELTPEYIKAVRFTVKRGNTYDAAEVDAFLDELLVAVTARQNTPDADTLAAGCTIRAEMTKPKSALHPCFRTKMRFSRRFFRILRCFCAQVFDKRAGYVII